MDKTDPNVLENENYDSVDIEFYRKFIFPYTWTGIMKINGGWWNRDFVDNFVSTPLEPKEVYIDPIRSFPEELESSKPFIEARTPKKLVSLAALTAPKTSDDEMYLLMFQGVLMNQMMDVLTRILEQPTCREVLIHLKSFTQATLPEPGTPIYQWEIKVQKGENGINIENRIWSGSWVPNFDDPQFVGSL